MAEDTGVGFTTDDVQINAQRWPWRRQQEFHEEIDPEEMERTRQIYARAAEEGVSAGELAQRASELAGGAGARDGRSLADGEQRAGETARGLQDNGGGLAKVADLLTSAIHRAAEADEEVYNLVLGENGLEEKYRRHVDNAAEEWNRLVADIQAKVDAEGYFSFTEAPPVTITFEGKQHTITPTYPEEGVLSYYENLGSFARSIRSRHLQAAVDDAVLTDDDITGAINAYRNRLLGYARELTAEGYDISEGPLNLWTNEEMARHASDWLSDLLANNPNPEDIRRALAGVEGILGGVYDTPYSDQFDAPGPSRKMTEAELAYLRTFYEGMTQEELAALGRLPYHDDLSDSQAAAADEAVRVAANGILLLTNPDAGGLDPARQRDDLPLSLTNYVYDYGRYLTPATHPDTVRDYAAFGLLMGRSDLAAGERFSRDLANAAIGIDQRTEDRTEGWIANPMNTGTREFFSVALRREGLAADMMSDPDFTDRMLGTKFPEERSVYTRREDGTSELRVRSFVDEATYLPNGVDGRSEEAKPYVDSAYNYLRYVEHEYTQPPDKQNLRQVDQTVVNRLVDTYSVHYPDRFERFSRLKRDPNDES
jgi:hypothetical protein